MDGNKDKFEYFIDQTNIRLSSMDKKLDTLITFRLLLLGSSATVSAVFSVLVSMLTVYLMLKGLK